MMFSVVGSVRRFVCLSWNPFSTLKLPKRLISDSPSRINIPKRHLSKRERKKLKLSQSGRKEPTNVAPLKSIPDKIKNTDCYIAALNNLYRKKATSVGHNLDRSVEAFESMPKLWTRKFGENRREIIAKWLGIPVLDPPKRILGIPSRSGKNLPLLMENLDGYSIKMVSINCIQSLNQMNNKTVSYLNDLIKKWSENTTNYSIGIWGSGDDAFCTGADFIEILKESSEEKRQKIVEDILQLNWTVIVSNKPLFIFGNGITAGLGASLFLNSAFRIATERTVFAFPETAFGFFPMGCSYALTHTLGGELGMYLALTGDHLVAQELVHCKLATHFMPQNRIRDFAIRLSLLYSSNIERFLYACSEYEDWVGYRDFSYLDERIRIINRCFAQEGVEAIINALESEVYPWANELAIKMKKLCPLSLKVTYRLLREARSATIESALELEKAVATRFLKHRDFMEGIRGMIIEKRIPVWSHQNVEQVTDEEVAEFFVLKGVQEAEEEANELLSKEYRALGLGGKLVLGKNRTDQALYDWLVASIKLNRELEDEYQSVRVQTRVSEKVAEHFHHGQLQQLLSLCSKSFGDLEASMDLRLRSLSPTVPEFDFAEDFDADDWHDPDPIELQ